MNKLVTRSEWAAYMACGTTPTFELIGEGFTSFAESKNPKEYSRQYVHERTERADVVGYAPSIAYSADVYSENPVILEVLAVTDGELVGSDAQREVVSVNLWQPAGTGGTAFKAYKRAYAIIPDGKGDGTEALIYTGTLKAVGDAVAGTFDTASKTFTAAGA